MESKDRRGGQGSDRTSDSDDDDEVRMKNSKLFAAIHDGQLEKVISLLEQGVKTDITDKNNKNNTPLHYAVEKGKIEITKELLNPKWRTNTNLKNRKGKTPLHIAFMRNHHEILQLLLSHRAKVGADNVENDQARSILVFDKAGKHIIFEEGKHLKGDSELLAMGGKPTTSNEQLKSDISNASSDTVEFVRTALRGVISVDDNEAEHLANELRHLQIPLKLAVVYIKVENQDLKKKGAKGNFTIKSYLKELQKHVGKVQKKGSGKNLDKCSEITTAAWKVTFDKINHQKGLGQLAVFMLNVMAHLGTEDIPVDEIFRRDQFSEKERDDALKLLEKYSMIQLEGRIASLHSLIQKETKMEIQRQGRNEELTKDTFQLLALCFLNSNATSEDRSKKQRIIRHSETFISCVDEWLKNKRKEMREEVENNIIGELLTIMFVDSEPNLEKNVQWCERALDISKRKYGAKHLKVGVILARMGGYYQSAGNALKAKELLESALAIVEKSPKVMNLLVCEVLSSLGVVYGELGDVMKKKELLERAYVRVVNGNELTMALLGRNAIVSLKQKVENVAECANIVFKILKNLGTVYCALGNTQKAKELLEKALKVVENCLGPDHLQAALVLTSLIKTYDALRYTQKRKMLLERASAIVEKYSGTDHFEVVLIITNMGIAYLELGVTAKAKNLLERALNMCDFHNGPDNIRARILENLARIFDVLEDAPKAIELQERVVALRGKQFGIGHFLVADALSSLGCYYAELGDYRKNRDLQERAFRKMTNTLDPQHLFLVNVLLNLSNVYAQSGEVSKQKEKLEQALAIQEQFHEPGDIQFSSTLTRLGNVYLTLRDPWKAKNFFKRALAIHENHYGRDHHTVGNILVGLSHAYKGLGCMQKQKEILEKTLEIEEKHYGTHHPEVATTLVNLGEVYGVLGDARSKKELQERALQIMENRYGRNHFHLVKILSYLGDAYSVLGDFEKSRDLQTRALAIAESNFGPEHFRIPEILSKLSCSYGNLGDRKKQTELFKRAVNAAEKIKITHPHLAPEINAILTKTCAELLFLPSSNATDFFLSEKQELEDTCEPHSLASEAHSVKKEIPQEGLSLYLAFEQGSLESIATLLEGGLDVLSKDNMGSVLHKAVSSNKKKIIRLILKKIQEKDPKNFIEHVNAKDCFGDTPLIWAAQNGRTKAAKELIAHGADVNARNHKGETALFWAYEGRFEKLQQILLSKINN